MNNKKWSKRIFRQHKVRKKNIWQINVRLNCSTKSVELKKHLTNKCRQAAFEKNFKQKISDKKS